MIRRVVFAKKFTLPSKTANVLQSATMAFAYAENGVRTTLLPGFKEPGYDLKDAYSLPAPNNIDIVALNGRHKGLYGLNFRLRLMAAWLTAHQQTVFYARDIKEALFLARLKRRLSIRRPLFFEMHEILAVQHKRQGTGKETVFRKQEEELLEQVDGIISISELLSEDIARVYAPKAPIFTAPMGFNPHIYAPVDDVDLSGSVNLAYVGSLYEGKGVHNLLKAMEYLPKSFHLRIIGGNPVEELNRLKADAAAYGDRVSFAGHLHPQLVAKELSSCHLFIIPQCTEAEFFSPIKLYEAMGMALPIISTPIPSIAKALRHGKDAFLADGLSPEEIANAIRTVSSDPELVHAMQGQCRKNSPQFSWKARAENCLKFMEETLSSTREKHV